MLHNDPIIKEKQGYYYTVEVTWETNPGKTFIHEYGNEYSAKKACENWNKFPDAKATYRKVML